MKTKKKEEVGRGTLRKTNKRAKKKGKRT